MLAMHSGNHSRGQSKMNESRCLQTKNRLVLDNQ